MAIEFRCCNFRTAALRGLMNLLICTLGARAIYMRSEPGEPPEYCTMFNHMVKSGGSTIKGKLFGSSRMEGLPIPATCINGPGSEQACMDALHNSPVAVGYVEMLRQVNNTSIERECEFFTVMRHPIDRLISAFFYCPTDHDIQERPRKFCGYAEDEGPATQRLVEFARDFWRNKAFRQMSFGLYCPPAAFCEQAVPGAQLAVTEPGGWDLLQQIQAIMGTYTAIGFLEHWELSMRLFDAKVKSPVRDWENIQISNSGTMSELRDSVYRWAHMSPEIHNILATDMLLYDYALSVFKLQTAATLGTVWE
ncbi:unnamed protein product [Ascophyllum nodosum]